MWHLASKFDGCALLQPQSRHPFCIMEGSESYDAFRDSLGDMLEEINEMQNSPLDCVATDGQKHTIVVRFLLTGDNKFVHICQGIDKANAPHFALTALAQRTTSQKLHATGLFRERLKRPVGPSSL